MVECSRDPATDLCARINAANTLGALGDPGFEERQGPLGRFLLPPMVAIGGGVYAIGSDEGLYENEAPRHKVELGPFSLGQFPVTNAEFQCFIDAGGYQDERWWDTPAAQRWQRGEGTGEGHRENWQHWRNRLMDEVGLLARIAEEQAWTEEQTQQWQDHCTMTDEAFEAMLLEKWPDQQFSQPGYWNNPAFNALNYPVVGVCWFEARAYCAWLSVQTGQCFRLSTEAEWEAATSGKEGRRHAWGDTFDVIYCNTLNVKLRRTSPVGVFPSGDTPSLATQDGCSDLSGNVWEWTGSCYTPYPYKADDGREDTDVEETRVLRGCSWDDDPGSVRSSARFNYHPDGRYFNIGFRVLCSSPIE
ncbi:MAG: formylglycine-generating enzyme family protein [Betaproteobacteria bacterium]|nr:formylglycine-generating enzyme family protein [Betaproteobacteria bacterium]